MRIRFLWVVAAASSLGLLAGCAAPSGQGNAVFPSPGPRGGVCNAQPAQAVIGKQGTASVVEQARVLSGAAMARVLRQGQAVTLEFNAERLNLTVDAQGRITAVHCG